MDCPRCDLPTRVLESRRADAGASTRRRRACPACGHRFTTYERRQREPLYVIKRGGNQQRFDPAKLRAALLRSTHKRQVSAADVEALVERVAIAIETAGGELEAERIGELCLEGLAELDRGAYLQFLGTLPSAGPLAAKEMADFADSSEPHSVRGARESASLPAQPG
ncbi:MAG TPA: ATP cone domain-containing protein [Solirubrobacterales bacterium]|jgi:transcriptional repressor NrdR